jgi:hypothetical protein
MTFRSIDDNDEGADEYYKKHFLYKNRTNEESNSTIADMYLKISPKMIELINKYMIENKEYMSFAMFSRFLGLFMLKSMDNNVRTHAEKDRRYLMKRATGEIKQFMDNYMENVDFSGSRPDPKYFSESDEDK